MDTKLALQKLMKNEIKEIDNLPIGSETFFCTTDRDKYLELRNKSNGHAAYSDGEFRYGCVVKKKSE